MNRLLWAAWGAFLPAAIVVAWELAAYAGAAPKYLSSPSAIAVAVAGLATTGELGRAVAVSLMRAYAGFAIGASIGLVAGLAAGLVPFVRGVLDPLVAFLYPVPKIAFLPVFLLVLGLGHASAIGIVALAVVFPVFLAARHAVAGIERNLILSAHNMGASGLAVFFRVVLPAALPQIFAGLRVAMALSFVVLFAAELTGARDGLGLLVAEGQEALRFDLMLAAIFGFAFLGFVSDLVLMRVRHQLLRGQMIGTEEWGH